MSEDLFALFAHRPVWVEITLDMETNCQNQQKHHDAPDDAHPMSNLQTCNMQTHYSTTLIQAATHPLHTLPASPWSLYAVLLPLSCDPPPVT